MKTVTGNTRAGINGIMIGCPHCARVIRVYHLAWCAICCPSCRADVEKTEWVIPGPASYSPMALKRLSGA